MTSFPVVFYCLPKYIVSPFFVHTFHPKQDKESVTQLIHNADMVRS